MSLLEVRGLSISLKSEKTPVRLVNNLSFAIKESEVFGLVGESGCGKSLTGLAIMGILPRNIYAEGSIVFNDVDLLETEKEKLREIRGKEMAMIFQEPMTSLNPVFTVGYQISECLSAHIKIPAREAFQKTIGLLKSVRMPSPDIRINEYPHQMSGGMRQRVMIAMAIACGPKILIADEPTTALDVTIQAQILELLRNLKEDLKMSMLLITHDLGIVAENTDRVAVMYAGRFVETADTEELLNNPRHPYTIGLLGSLPVRKGKPLTPIKGSVPDFTDLPDGCKFSDRCIYVMEKCREKEPELIVTGQNHLTGCIRAGESLWIS